MDKKALAEFIQDEMRVRKMNLTQFAQYVGVAHPTIGRALDLQNPTVPSLDFLDKLARATHTDLCTLVAMVFPDATRANPTVRILTQRISRLKEADQHLLDRFLLTLIQTNGEEGHE